MLRILDPSLAGQTAHAASVLPHRFERTLPELCANLAELGPAPQTVLDTRRGGCAFAATLSGCGS